MPLLEILFYAVLFLLACFSFAYFLKKKFKAQLLFRIVSIIRSKKPLPIFEKLSKHHSFLRWFANIGLILGFGSIAVDYLYGRKLSFPKRIVLFAVSFTILYYFLYILMGGNPLNTNFSLTAALMLSSFALFGLAGFIIILLGINAVDAVQKILVGQKALAGIAPLIPGLQIPNVPIFVPLHGWLSLLIILIVHEGFHGIIARMHKMKLKSAGLILFGFLPIGAFVEPDEKKFEKEKPLKKLQVLSSGPMANLALFAVAFGIFMLLSPVFITPYITNEVKVAAVPQYLMVNGVEQLAPAFGKLNVGDTMLEVNGKKISSTEEFKTVIKNPQTLEFKVKSINGAISMQTIKKNSEGLIGASFYNLHDLPPINQIITLVSSPDFQGNLFISFLFWLAMLNLFVATANFMPFWAFDGGKIVQIMLLPYFKFAKMPQKDAEKLIARIFLWVIGILLLVNALPLFQF